MGIYVGLDCGGSSSRVIAMDDDGTQLFVGSSGAANILNPPDHRLRRNLESAARGCPKPTHVCGCFAGLINDDTRRRAESILGELFPGAKVRAEPDYWAAFFASPPGTDVCVIAGTGSLICSWSDRKIIKSGGRGYIIGDIGAGFQYGRDALVAFLEDPTATSAGLRETIISVFGSDQEAEIVSTLYRSATPAMLLAKLMKPLGVDAQAQLDYAVESVERNTYNLAVSVAKHIEKSVPKTDISVCLAGGVWKASNVFTAPFTQHLNSRLPDRTINVQKIARPPLHGAVALAKELSRGH